MKLVFGALFLFVTLMLVQPADALYDPINLKTIPAPVAPNSGFLMYMDNPGDWAEPMRVEWEKYGPPNCLDSTNHNAAFFGHMPKLGDRWVCYFSSIDGESTCGPSPFLGCSGGMSHQINMIAVNSAGLTANNTFAVQLADIDLDTVITQNNSLIGMRVCGISDNLHQTTPAQYEVYSDNLTLVDGDYLTYDSFCYTGEVDLETPGTYYISFLATATNASRQGSDLKKIVIAGTETPENGDPPITADVEYEFATQEITLGEDTETWNGRGTVTNTGSDTYANLTIEVPQSISQYLSAVPSKISISPGEVLSFTIYLTGVDQGMEIHTNIYLKSADQLIAKIPIKIDVTKLGGGGIETIYVTEETVMIAGNKDPFIKGSSVSGVPLTYTITLENHGDEPMVATDFDKTVSPYTTGVTVTFPSASIPVNGTGDVEIEIISSYEGKITLETTVGTKDIFVAVDFSQDISSSISSQESRLDNIKTDLTESQDAYLSDIIGDIEDTLSDASSATDPVLAKTYLDKATGMIDTLGDTYSLVGSSGVDPPDNGGFDIFGLLIPIVIVVIILLVVVFVFMYIKGKKSGGEEGFEESTEFEEDEFGPPPE